MDKFRLWKRWLLIAGTVMVGFGAALAFLSGMPFFEAFNEQFNARSGVQKRSLEPN